MLYQLSYIPTQYSLAKGVPLTVYTYCWAALSFSCTLVWVRVGKVCVCDRKTQKIKQNAFYLEKKKKQILEWILVFKATNNTKTKKDILLEEPNWQQLSDLFVFVLFLALKKRSVLFNPLCVSDLCSERRQSAMFQIFLIFFT